MEYIIHHPFDSWKKDWFDDVVNALDRVNHDHMLHRNKNVDFNRPFPFPWEGGVHVESIPAQGVNSFRCKVTIVVGTI